MAESNASSPLHRCLFCRMSTDIRFLGIFMCVICRDQFYDFLWASLVQAVVTVTFQLGGAVFVVQEILLFVVLVIVKHRLPPPWNQAHSVR